jgi:predicted nucleic acid-binding Zn ribbon protein
MSYYMIDRQCDPSHPCIICGREIYGDYDVCQRCQERMKEDDE